MPGSLGRAWDWRQWLYHPSSGQVCSRQKPAAALPYNYLIFSVSSETDT